MDDRQTYRDTLFYALAIAGSERELAGHLKVTLRQLKDWLDGVDAIPDAIFDATLDLVIDSSPQAIFRSRGFLQRLAR